MVIDFKTFGTSTPSKRKREEREDTIVNSSSDNSSDEDDNSSGEDEKGSDTSEEVVPPQEAAADNDDDDDGAFEQPQRDSKDSNQPRIVKLTIPSSQRSSSENLPSQLPAVLLDDTTDITASFLDSSTKQDQPSHSQPIYNNIAATLKLLLNMKVSTLTATTNVLTVDGPTTFSNQDLKQPPMWTTFVTLGAYRLSQFIDSNTRQQFTGSEHQRMNWDVCKNRFIHDYASLPSEAINAIQDNLTTQMINEWVQVLNDRNACSGLNWRIDPFEPKVQFYKNDGQLTPVFEEGAPLSMQLPNRTLRRQVYKDGGLLWYCVANLSSDDVTATFKIAFRTHTYGTHVVTNSRVRVGGNQEYEVNAKFLMNQFKKKRQDTDLNLPKAEEVVLKPGDVLFYDSTLFLALDKISKRKLGDSGSYCLAKYAWHVYPEHTTSVPKQLSIKVACESLDVGGDDSGSECIIDYETGYPTSRYVPPFHMIQQKSKITNMILKQYSNWLQKTFTKNEKMLSLLNMHAIVTEGENVRLSVKRLYMLSLCVVCSMRE